MTQAAAVVAWRAQWYAWRVHAREMRWVARHWRARHRDLLLTLAGAAAVVGGAWLVGRWAAGLAITGLGLFTMWVGLNRDDGADLPVAGARTVEQVLDDERLRP